MEIPDPLELIESRIDRLASEYEEGKCMNCGKIVAYELVCAAPDGPAMCYDCAGICEDCGGSGQVCTGYSGNDDDGNAPITERCPSCGYGDTVG